MTGSLGPLRDGLLLWAARVIAPALLRLLGATWRIRVVDAGRLERAQESGRNVIFALWHGQLLPLQYAHRGRGICTLASLHRDGRMAAGLLTSLGYAVVDGSTTRGAARGLLGLLENLNRGRDAAITTDGPRGPARRAQTGIFFLSERAGAPVVPVAASASRAKLLSSWDSFVVPMPFARVAVAYGEPIEPDATRDAAERAEELTSILDCLTERARVAAER